MADWRADFKQFHQTIRLNYAYWPGAVCDWARVPAAYEADLAAVKNLADFVTLLERVMGELCDAHASLGTNLSSSYCLVPSGTDIWVEARDSGVFVTDVRTESEAAQGELKPGMLLVSVGASRLLRHWSSSGRAPFPKRAFQPRPIAPICWSPVATTSHEY